MPPTSFNNRGSVQNQVGNQIIHGNSYQHHHYHSDDVATRKRPRLRATDTEPENSLDDLIMESLAFPEMTQRRRNIESPHLRTCEWIFHTVEYNQWTTQCSGLLWIKGKPGAGKSTLMSHLYSDLQSKLQSRPSDEICLEYFFTARGAPLEHSPLGMFRSLLNQIFSFDSSVRTPLRKAFRDHQTSFNNIIWQWQQAELQHLFTETVVASARQHPTVIFIDALDEAGLQAAEETARYFHTLNDRASEFEATLRICIACRHFPVPVIRQKALEIHVEKHNLPAIQSYIHDYIENYIDVAQFDTEFYKNLLPTLCQMANGVFQWAYQVMPLIRNRIANGGSSKQFFKWLSQLSTNLDQVYEYILEQVIEDKVSALRLFQWVCLATRPLSVTELRYAIATYDLIEDDQLSEWETCPNFVESDGAMERCIRAWSGGLIEMKQGATGEELLAQPVHLSVQSYIVSRGLNLLAQHASVESEKCKKSSGIATLNTTKPVESGHGQLYWCCLHFLAFEEARFSALVPVFEFWESASMQDWAKRTFPFTIYAVGNALNHARSSQEHRPQSFTRESHLLKALISFERMLYNRGSTTLHMASAANLNDLTKYLLSLGLDFSAKDKSGETPLYTAVRYDSREVAQTLVNAGVDVNMPDYRGHTLLMLAAGHGHEVMFRWLLQHGASILALTARKETALSFAAFKGNIVLVRLCLSAGADVDAQGGEYGTALQAAASRGSIETVQALLAAGAEINAQGGFYGTALQAAAYRGSIETVQALLAAGAEINAQGGFYGTALQAAAYRGSIETVQALLAAGAEINAQGGFYGTALQAAAYRGSIETVQALLAAGADVDAQGGEHGTALQAAAYRGSIETVQALLAAGADVDAQGGFYGNALQAAVVMATHATEGDEEVVKTIGYSLYRSGIEIFQALLEAGADVNAQGGKYGCALGAAIKLEDEKLIQLLREAGAREPTR